MPQTLTASALKKTMQAFANPERAEHSLRFFKTGKGQYGEGDRFLGLTMPDQRKVAQQWIDMPIAEAQKMLASPWHEHRLIALLIWVYQYPKANAATQADLYAAYLQAVADGHVNNWDLVDASAMVLVGRHMCGDDGEPKPAYRKKLKALAQSQSLWERRVAMLAHFHNIRLGRFASAIEMATQLLNDHEDLMHKVVGWMLREIGKRDKAVLKRFLDENAATMPRTTLRYSLEHFSVREKAPYMTAKSTAKSAAKPARPFSR